MNVMPASPERVSEVLRLCTLLADRALDARIMGRPVPSDQTAALAKAARFLQDHGVEWPPLLTQVLHELADNSEQQGPDSEVEALNGIDAQGLTHFFAALWREKRQP
ncbi:hypothetical protein ACRAWG_36540 [Methylobacterium sp. P31]